MSQHKRTWARMVVGAGVAASILAVPAVASAASYWPPGPGRTVAASDVPPGPNVDPGGGGEGLAASDYPPGPGVAADVIGPEV